MQTRILVWARRVAAVLLVLLAGGAAPAAGLLAPFFLAAQTANILLPTISAVASFALWAWAGTRLALSCWGTMFDNRTPFCLPKEGRQWRKDINASG